LTTFKETFLFSTDDLWRANRLELYRKLRFKIMSDRHRSMKGRDKSGSV
jgi:hypothetical protein